MLRRAVFLLVLFTGFAAVAHAQSEVRLGPRIGLPVSDMSDLEGQLFLGADARISTEELPVVLSPSLDFYLFDSPSGVDQSGFAIDLNALYEFGIENEVFVPYAGGGLGITRYSQSLDNGGFGGFGNDFDTTEVGLNIVGGARFLVDPVEPFVQANLTVGGDIERVGLAVGVLFSL